VTYPDDAPILDFDRTRGASWCRSWAPIRLGNPRVIAGVGVTHLRYLAHPE